MNNPLSLIGWNNVFLLLGALQVAPILFVSSLLDSGLCVFVFSPPYCVLWQKKTNQFRSCRITYPTFKHQWFSTSSNSLVLLAHALHFQVYIFQVIAWFKIVLAKWSSLTTSWMAKTEKVVWHIVCSFDSPAEVLLLLEY